jgi:hypothetical protein
VPEVRQVRGGPKDWSVRVERIYDSDHLFEENLPDSQRVWEMDLLIPDDCESALFAMSIFGLEFAINLIGPDPGRRTHPGATPAPDAGQAAKLRGPETRLPCSLRTQARRPRGIASLRCV